LRRGERGEKRVAEARLQSQVVEGNVERLRRAAEERGYSFGDGVRGLAAVSQEEQIERRR
jgi:hypothetical protein